MFGGMNTANATETPVDEPDLDSYTDLTVGEILKRTREYYGQTLPQVEVNLRIRASQLYALEEGDLAQLPGRVYAIGFVRAYSEYLGLDGDKMVRLFKAQSVGKRVKPELQFPVTYEDSKTPNLAIILSSLVLTILFIAYWTIFYTPTNYVEKIPPVPERLKESTLTLSHPKIKKPEPVSIDVLKVPDNKMELVITADSWVEIRDGEGNVTTSRVMKPGDKYIVPSESDLYLTTGNAGGIKVMIDEEESGTIGEKAEVKRNIALQPSNFSKDSD